MLQQLPAENDIQRDLVLSAILEQSEQVLLSLASELESDDANTRVHAEYAWHGLALYVSADGIVYNREKYLSLVDKALQQKLNLENRIFLLEQLKFVPGALTVKIAGKYLSDNDLGETAVMVLRSNNSHQAAEVLLANLGDTSTPLKIARILALAEMDYKPLAEVVNSMLPVDNENLESAIMIALSELGFADAEKAIRDYADKNPEQNALLITFADALTEQGQKATSAAIFREVLQNESGQYSETSRKAALSGLSNLLGDDAFAEIFQVYQSSDKKMRMAALNLAKPHNSNVFVEKWLSLMPSLDTEKQLELIEFFGDIKSTNSIPFLQEKLSDNEPIIQAAAIRSIYKFKGSGISDDLVTVLQGELDGEFEKETHALLDEVPDSTALASIVNGFESYSVSGQKIILSLVAEKNLSAFNNFLTASLKSDQSEIRSGALGALDQLALKKNFEILTDFYLQTNDGQETSKTIKALASSFDGRLHTDFLIKKIDDVSDQQKIKLLKLYSRLKGQAFYHKAVALESYNGKEVSEQAAEIVFSWKDENALEDQLKIAQTTRDSKRRINAIQNSVQILRERNINKDDLVSYCDLLLKASERPEEKRLVMSVLTGLKNKSALNLILKNLDDPDVEYEAFLALLKWAESERNPDHYSIEDLIVYVLNGRVSKSLSQKITKYRQEQFEPKPPEGFTALFNGKDLSGWKGLVANPAKRAQMSADEMLKEQQKADSIMNAQWSVVDGILYFKGIGYQNICTVKSYQNFEMYMDWKIEKGGDSGIYLRGTPQVQIWDPGQWDEGSGGLYNNQKNPRTPLKKADKPIGEWNTFHIIMQGERVTVYLNNELVVDNIVLENYWERDKALYASDQIELQAHNNPLYFRNIYIKELPAGEPLFSGDLFNGKDLSGWQVINNTDDSWHVEDGILYTEGQGGGWISTEKEYGDFDLQLEFRVPEGGNSGVFIRAPHEGDPAYTGMEIQVLDDYAEKYATLKPWQYTGSVYGLQAPAKRVTKKAGEWQKMHITCQGPKIRVELNEQEIVNTNLINFGSEIKAHPGIKRRKGFIGLQNHSTRVEYRNIKLTELP
ncbi:MAG: DUF1080 domain-containing protein [Calditrichaeota bacterium]|nr:DUF1080 domain-containing protein [Calditrichota bacterium]